MTKRTRQLILVRHAHAVEAEDYVGEDFDRPLTPRGKESATIVARYLRLIGIKPQYIISSPAKRTKSTAELIAQELELAQIKYIDDLYNGRGEKGRDASEVHLSVIQHLDDDIDVAVLVGHNDDITEFARYLTDEEVPSLKKGSLVVLALKDESWEESGRGEFSFLYYLTPQFLRLEEITEK